MGPKMNPKIDPKIDPKMKYIICQNGSLSWSVQIDKTIFFKKMSFSDLKEELTNTIKKKYESQVKSLKKENKKLKAALKEIKKL